MVRPCYVSHNHEIESRIPRNFGASRKYLTVRTQQIRHERQTLLPRLQIATWSVGESGGYPGRVKNCVVCGENHTSLNICMKVNRSIRSEVVRNAGCRRGRQGSTLCSAPKRNLSLCVELGMQGLQLSEVCRVICKRRTAFSELPCHHHNTAGVVPKPSARRQPIGECALSEARRIIWKTAHNLIPLRPSSPPPFKRRRKRVLEHFRVTRGAIALQNMYRRYLAVRERKRRAQIVRVALVASFRTLDKAVGHLEAKASAMQTAEQASKVIL